MDRRVAVLAKIVAQQRRAKRQMIEKEPRTK